MKTKRPSYQSLLNDLPFKVEDGERISRRFPCHKCMIPIAEMTKGPRTVLINVDGSLHNRSCTRRSLRGSMRPPLHHHAGDLKR